MSKMTREEAVAELTKWAKLSQSFGTDTFSRALAAQHLEAIAILAPEPRTEPPGVEEVGDEEMCWYWEKTCWYVTVGCDVREGMIGGEYWLPLSALPMPKGGA